MDSKTNIIETIYGCIEVLNQQLPESGRLAKSLETVIAGNGGVLDSLSLITLLVDVEQALAERHDISVSLLDGLMDEDKNQAMFHTVATLLEWVQQQQMSAKKTD